MLLRRITRPIGQENWFAVFVDFVISSATTSAKSRSFCNS